jgi:hypothetical protein
MDPDSGCEVSLEHLAQDRKHELVPVVAVRIPVLAQDLAEVVHHSSLDVLEPVGLLADVRDA